MAHPTPDQATNEALGQNFTALATGLSLKPTNPNLSINTFQTDLGCTMPGPQLSIPVAACSLVNVPQFRSYQGIPLTDNGYLDSSKPCTLQLFSDEYCNSAVTDARRTGAYCYHAPDAQQSYQPGQQLFAFTNCSSTINSVQ